MFCNKCGAQIPENGKFCLQCGTPVDGGGFVQQPIPVQKPRKSVSKSLIGGIAVAAVAIILAILVAMIMVNTSDAGFKNLVNKHVQSMIDGDSRAMVSTLPRSWVTMLILEEYDGDRNEFYDELDDEIVYLSRQIRENDMEITWEIVDIAEISESMEDDLEDMEDMMNTRISDCRIVTVDLIATMDGDVETREEEIILGKIGLKWYVINPMGF